MIGREEFLHALNDVCRAVDYEDRLNDFIYNNATEGYVIQPNCATTVVKLLHEVFGEADRDEWIDYWCWELNFGRKWKSGMVRDSHGNDVRLQTADDLYDLLMSLMD